MSTQSDVWFRAYKDLRDQYSELLVINQELRKGLEEELARDERIKELERELTLRRNHEPCRVFTDGDGTEYTMVSVERLRKLEFSESPT